MNVGQRVMYRYDPSTEWLKGTIIRFRGKGIERQAVCCPSGGGLCSVVYTQESQLKEKE